MFVTITGTKLVILKIAPLVIVTDCPKARAGKELIGKTPALVTERTKVKLFTETVAAPKGGKEVIFTTELSPKSGKEVIFTEELSPKSGREVIAIVVPDTVNGELARFVIVGIKVKLFMDTTAAPRGGSDVIFTDEFKPKSGSEVIFTVLPKPKSGKDVILTEEPRPKSGNDVIATEEPTANAGKDNIWTGSPLAVVTGTKEPSPPTSILTHWCNAPPLSSAAIVTPVPEVTVILSAHIFHL